MSTHNCLVKLGEMTYLEAIAPDPDAPRPERTRWFELDALEESSPARLASWVVRVNDIEARPGRLSNPAGQDRGPEPGAIEMAHQHSRGWQPASAGHRPYIDSVGAGTASRQQSG